MFTIPLILYVVPEMEMGHFKQENNEFSILGFFLEDWTSTIYDNKLPKRLHVFKIVFAQSF